MNERDRLYLVHALEAVEVATDEADAPAQAPATPSAVSLTKRAWPSDLPE